MLWKVVCVQLGYTARLASRIPRLYVNVNVVGLAFGISLEYGKTVIDEASGLRGLATTWARGFTGTHGRDASYILSGVSELMDLFLVEFLRANEEAC